MTISKIATAESEVATAVASLNLTVPAGVTTSHFGVLVVGTTASTPLTITATGWTARVTSPTGEGNTDAHFFTRLGGVAAGNTVTVSIGASQQSPLGIYACWYDTQGRDVATVGTVYTRNGSTITTTQFPGVAVTGARDVLLVALDRTAGTPTISSWSPSTPTVDGYLTTTDRGTLASGGTFAHFAQASTGTTPTYTATYSASGTNGIGVQLVLAAPSNIAPTANAGPDQSNIEPWSTVLLDGSASSDSDGTVASYAWTQTAGTTVTLTGSGATRTYTAPGTLAGETETFSLTVTDNGGASSTADTVNISVLPVTERAVIGGVEVPMQVRTS